MNHQLNKTNKINPKFTFEDWSPYQTQEVIDQLTKLGITYTPPKANEQLRRRVEENVTYLDKDSLTMLLTLLRFIERGQLVDNFKSDEESRHNFLLKNNVIIKLNGEEQKISLYKFSKIVNKLAANPLSSIVTIGQIVAVDNNIDEKTREELRQRANEIKEFIESKKQDPGYFIPQDLDPIKEFALALFDFIIR